MSECYKCGRQLTDGQVECDPPCFGNPEEHVQFTDEQIIEAIRRQEAREVEIDWAKVRTFEDLKEIIQFVYDDIRVERGTPAFKALRRFLKESNVND